MQPYYSHRHRVAAPPICQDGRAIYSEATEEQVEAAYNKAYPNGCEPVLSIDLPASEEDAQKFAALLSPPSVDPYAKDSFEDAVSAFLSSVKVTRKEPT
jgi:hypothetical protein